MYTPNFQKGELNDARRNLELASENSFRMQDQERYQAKLAALSSIMESKEGH